MRNVKITRAYYLGSKLTKIRKRHKEKININFSTIQKYDYDKHHEVRYRELCTLFLLLLIYVVLKI